MTQTITVRLGGVDYALRKFTIGQLQRLFATETTRSQFGFEVLKLALERAEPQPPAIDEMEIGVDEFRAAVDRILDFSGLKKAGEAQAGAAPER